MINTVLLGYSFLLVKGLYYPKTKISVSAELEIKYFSVLIQFLIPQVINYIMLKFMQRKSIVKLISFKVTSYFDS